MKSTTHHIGFTGTTSCGKTTLVKALAELPEFQNFHIATERSKYLRDLGIPLNTDSTLKGQFVFAAERASELMYENLLTDRTIWDVCAFTFSSDSIDESDQYDFAKALMCLKDYYDIIFYISPDGIPIEDNKIRTTDPEYRVLIDETIKDLLIWYPPKKLITLKGTTEERIKVVMHEYLSSQNNQEE